MKEDKRIRRVLRAVQHYAVFFLLVAFVITCCMMLFVQILTHTMGVTLTEATLAPAAKWTFANVVFLSLLFTVFDILRRRYTVRRPVRQITAAARRMMKGDFEVRIPYVRGQEAFDPIIDCFNEMARELSGTATLRTDFIANVSHEIKTPLAVMQNYAVMLQSPGLSEAERLEYAGAIKEASRRLADLVSNILKLNKLENQQLVLSAAPYDLGEQLCECLLGFEELWEKKELELETAIEDGVIIRADGELLSLVWNNLFSNAIKFTAPGGRIGLSLQSEGEYAVVRVSDTGCGISQEVGAHIFEKFYQGDPSHSTGGNGLGLALVKRVIDLTGNTIAVESELGKGTVFTVRLRRG